jgi:hypothetical protein
MDDMSYLSKHGILEVLDVGQGKARASSKRVLQKFRIKKSKT